MHVRFVLVCILLVAVTVAVGLWSALAFARLSAAANNALRASQEKLDLTAQVAASLEREDDDLLLALSGSPDQARRDLRAEREHGDSRFRQLQALLQEGGGQDAAARLRQEIDDYRASVDRLMEAAPGKGNLERYHREVNPRLRSATATCSQLREEYVSYLREAGLHARDDAWRATWVMAGASVAAVLLATVILVRLARSILVPVRALTESVEAVRRGDFDRRVRITSEDELGRLAAGFNRMAETLAEYRQSSLGELLAAKMTLEATLNALPDAVFVVAPEGALDALNPPARALRAVLAPAARTLAELPLRPEHRAAVEGALAGKASLPARTHFGLTLQATVEGRPRRFLLSAVPIPEFAPHKFGAAVVLEDVTDFARLDELRGELIGLASHELKSPLSSVQLNLALLAEEVRLPAEHQEMLEVALRGCRELANTINELLDMTRVEAGQLRLDVEPLDLNTVVDGVLANLQSRIKETGVRVQVVRSGGRAMVKGDPARLANVLTNFLTNALKYSPPGGAVTVALSGNPATVQVAVSDQGPGVPPEFREQIFEKFFRVEHYRERGASRVRGTGIGLHLCREIMRAHGGSIRCEAGEGGVGTRMVFALPASNGT